MRVLVLILLAALATPLPALPALPEGEPLAGLRICVDAGHGGQIWGRTRGYTAGTRSVVSDTTESDVNLRTALLLWDYLTQAGAEVVMTRTFETRLTGDCLAPTDSEVYRENRSAELGIRRRVAEANDCDFMVSIHHNAVSSGDVNFATVFFFDPDTYREAEGEDPPVEHPAENVAAARGLAEAILTHVSERLEYPTRPARHGNYHILRESPLPVVIVEASFMTNPDAARRLDDLAHNRLEALGIFEGILDHVEGTD